MLSSFCPECRSQSPLPYMPSTRTHPTILAPREVPRAANFTKARPKPIDFEDITEDTFRLLVQQFCSQRSIDLQMQTNRFEYNTESTPPSFVQQLALGNLYFSNSQISIDFRMGWDSWQNRGCVSTFLLLPYSKKLIFL